MSRLCAFLISGILVATIISFTPHNIGSVFFIIWLIVWGLFDYFSRLKSEVDNDE